MTYMFMIYGDLKIEYSYHFGEHVQYMIIYEKILLKLELILITLSFVKKKILKRIYNDLQSVGSMSLNENLADNEGFKVALNAYRTWRNKNGEEKRLPSLNQTNEQLFWISAVSSMCTKRTAENKKLQRFTDEHAGEEIRMNGAVSNSADFAKAFNCPVNSPMNPQQKCNLF